MHSGQSFGIEKGQQCRQNSSDIPSKESSEYHIPSAQDDDGNLQEHNVENATNLQPNHVECSHSVEETHFNAQVKIQPCYDEASNVCIIELREEGISVPMHQVSKE